MPKNATFVETDALDDLNNGIKTIGDFSNEELAALNDFANERPDLPIAGNIRNALASFVTEADTN